MECLILVVIVAQQILQYLLMVVSLCGHHGVRAHDYVMEDNTHAHVLAQIPFLNMAVEAAHNKGLDLTLKLKLATHKHAQNPVVTLCGAPGALAQPHVALDNAPEHVHAQTLLPQLEDPTASNKGWDQHQRLKTVLDYKLAKSMEDTHFGLHGVLVLRHVGMECTQEHELATAQAQ